jgi:hypothetical protein
MENIMKIVIELDSELIDKSEIKANEKVIRYLLMDALYEFQANRGPSPERYVNTRYPDNHVYKGDARRDKINEVANRIKMADILHRSVGSMRILWE